MHCLSLDTGMWLRSHKGWINRAIISHFLCMPFLFPKIKILGFFVTALLCWLMFMLWFAMTLTFSFLVLHLCVSVCFQSILFSLVISSSECTKFFGLKSSSYFPVWRFFFPPLSLLFLLLLCERQHTENKETARYSEETEKPKIYKTNRVKKEKIIFLFQWW